MPCRIPPDAEIPLARYGKSNVGQMKTIYRRGLGFRYGRHMQTIAGVHFNYSLPEEFWPRYQELLGERGEQQEFRSDQYLGLIRNFRRFGWMVLYLFGASPAMCKSFGAGSDLDMPSLNAETWYQPYGTSLRMSDLGYSNQNQSRLNISLNSLDEYIQDLSSAIKTPEPDYEEIGVKVDGKYRQLSTSSLQIENEYYSPVRPKRVASSGERPTAALRRGGIEYVEIRSLDINIDDPAGVNQNTMRFIEAFLIYCLLEDSPPLDEAACVEASRNQALTARQGRDPDFRLHRGGAEVALATWANEILDKVTAVAELVDRADGSDCYTHAVQIQRNLVSEPMATPSARLLEELKAAQCGFFDYAIEVSRGHRDYFASITPLSSDRLKEFEREASRSIEEQLEIEARDNISLMQLLQLLGGRSHFAIRYLPAVGFKNWRQFTHGATRKYFVRGIELSQRNIALVRHDRIFAANLENHLPSQSWQATVCMRCADNSISDDKQVGVVSLGYEAVDIKHYCAVNAGNIRLD